MTKNYLVLSVLLNKYVFNKGMFFLLQSDIHIIKQFSVFVNKGSFVWEDFFKLDDVRVL